MLRRQLRWRNRSIFLGDLIQGQRRRLKQPTFLPVAEAFGNTLDEGDSEIDGRIPNVQKLTEMLIWT